MRMTPTILFTLLALTASPPVFAHRPTASARPIRSVATVTLSSLTPNQQVGGFTTLCVYTGDGGKPIGARFRHNHTGYIFDYLQMDSVPQAFMYCNTPPTSDKGEPHTQEHLLLGKGNRGRAVATAETLTMSESSAYTEQWRTCFFFNTTAGADAFYGQLRMRLDALLHPDYTDEEVRREVRNFGVAENPDGTRRLEEKGSVYNEMVSTMDKSGSQLYRAMTADIYGANHPLAFEAGGTPEALRTLTPEEIRAFRSRDYYLGNMGMVAAFPTKLPLVSVLANVGGILDRLQPGPSLPSRPPVVAPKFPPPQPAPSKQVQIVRFPDQNAEQPGDIGLVWPANRSLDVTDHLLLELFLGNLASDADTPLYKRFIDAKTRSLETGATSVYAYVSDDEGQPIYMGLGDVKPSSLNESDVTKIRTTVLAELKRITDLPDGSRPLRAFNASLRSRLLAYRRAQSKFVNSPPGFGARMSSSAWMDQCRMLEGVPGFRKSVLMTPQLDEIENRLATDKNIWRTLLSQWKITSEVPYAVGAKADTGLVTQQAAERAARIVAEVARLKTKYGAAIDQEAIGRYKSDYDAETGRQNAIAARGKTGGRFLEHPPLTLDDDLRYRVAKAPVPIFAASFDTMTSATIRLNLSLKNVAPSDLVYLSALPSLLDSVGVIEKGVALSYEQTLERERREILSVGCGFDTNPDRDRYELEITGAGNNAAEAKRAAGWMRTLLTAPNWRPENLPRLRDVVDQLLQENRNRMLGQEEYWTSGIATAWRYQNSPLALSTGSFLTRTHDLQRLRWMLKETREPADGKAFIAFLGVLRSAGQAPESRSGLQALLAALAGDPSVRNTLAPGLQTPLAAFDALPTGAKSLAKEAAGDLSTTLNSLPEDSLNADWDYLCREVSDDFARGPAPALQKLDSLRRSLLSAAGARISVVGSAATEKALAPSLRSLEAVVTPLSPTLPASAASEALVSKRLRERIPGASPVFVGLVAPSMKGGVVMNEAPSAAYTSTDRESLLRFLAGGLYGGGGAESVFMKTWGAGLAYGNGIGSSPADARIRYYADHTPEIPQTVKFVIDTVRNAPRNPDLMEYSLANVFRSRASQDYESRAFSMANDLADGVTPDVVRTFRKALLALRSSTALVDDVYQRLPLVMGAILPGYSESHPEMPRADGQYMAIGPETQLRAYESYLKKIYGLDTTLYRLYPRDFWLVAPIAFPIPQPLP